MLVTVCLCIGYGIDGDGINNGASKGTIKDDKKPV